VRVSAALAAALLLGACATASTKPELAASSHAKARKLEKDGQLRPALLEWKVTRAIDANDAEARANEARLTARIEGLVATKVTEARGLLQRGAPLQARRSLLSALALDPANATAAEMLREVGDIEFVTYTVRAGDTLASLAERYRPQHDAGMRIEPPPSLACAIGTMPEATAPALPPDEPPEVSPLLSDAREAVEHKEFAAALADLDRFLAQNPGDREGAELKKLALYRLGQTALEEKKYDDSYRALTQLAKLQPDYQDVASLLPQARRQVIDRHYQEGIRLFREEKLPEAIAEWKIVLDLEPQNVNAKRNLEQAERLLKGLEQRKSR